jgi:hypothetical protein
VKIQERKAAQKLFSSSEGKALEAGVVDGAKAEAESSRGTMNGSGGLTEEQKQQIKANILCWAKHPPNTVCFRMLYLLRRRLRRLTELKDSCALERFRSLCSLQLMNP